MRQIVVSFDATGTLMRPRARIGATYIAHWQRVASASRTALSSSRREAFEAQVDARFPIAFRQHSQQFPNFGRSSTDTGTATATAEPWWSRVVLQSLPPELVAALAPDAQQQLTSSVYSYYATGDAWRVYDEVKPTLATLRSSTSTGATNTKVWTAVISDFDERLPHLLQELELLEFFDVVTTSWHVGHTKPSHAIFQHTRDALRDAAGLIDDNATSGDVEWLHVGDHATRDYGGAVAFGARARLLDRDGSLRRHRHRRLSTDGGTQHLISTLDEILPLV